MYLTVTDVSLGLGTGLSGSHVQRSMLGLSANDFIYPALVVASYMYLCTSGTLTSCRKVEYLLINSVE